MGIMIIDFIPAPAIIMIIGPNDTFGILFKIVKYGSIILYNNWYLQRIEAIVIPKIVPKEKLISTS